MSESIPLEQGLRHSFFSFSEKDKLSESFPLEQGLRQMMMLDIAKTIESESIPLKQGLTHNKFSYENSIIHPCNKQLTASISIKKCGRC